MTASGRLGQKAVPRTRHVCRHNAAKASSDRRRDGDIDISAGPGFGSTAGKAIQGLPGTGPAPASQGRAFRTVLQNHDFPHADLVTGFERSGAAASERKRKQRQPIPDPRLEAGTSRVLALPPPGVSPIEQHCAIFGCCNCCGCAASSEDPSAVAIVLGSQNNPAMLQFIHLRRAIAATATAKASSKPCSNDLACFTLQTKSRFTSTPLQLPSNRCTSDDTLQTKPIEEPRASEKPAPLPLSLESSHWWRARACASRGSWRPSSPSCAFHWALTEGFLFWSPEMATPNFVWDAEPSLHLRRHRPAAPGCLLSPCCLRGGRGLRDRDPYKGLGLRVYFDPFYSFTWRWTCHDEDHEAITVTNCRGRWGTPNTSRLSRQLLAERRPCSRTRTSSMTTANLCVHLLNRMHVGRRKL